MKTIPIVAIVGRPNVGKSSLFNRLVGRRESIVSHVSGTTRDRIMAETTWYEFRMMLVDTGGLDVFPDEDIWKQVKYQIDVAIEDADVIMMVVDSFDGVTDADKDVANIIRRSDKPVVLVANKCDNDARNSMVGEFHQLGLSDPIAASAYHNFGIDEIMTRVSGSLPNEVIEDDSDVDVKIAVLGRTNVGKSSLVNSITKQQRSIVSDIPGTTRDSLDTLIEMDDWTISLVDTAGIRRRGKIEPGIEHFSVLRAMRSINRSDVVILMLDTSELAMNQDTHIAQYILDSFKGVVVNVNKWDLSRGLGISKDEALKHVMHQFRFISYAPICFTNSLSSEGEPALLKKTLEVFDERNKTVPRYELRRIVMNAIAEHPPATSGRKGLKIFSVKQDQTSPPSFTFYVNSPELVHFSYQRYLENAIRKKFAFSGSPLRLRFRHLDSRK